MRPHLIGYSEEGRPIPVLHAGDEAAPLRILIVAGQHGDEGRGRRTVGQFAPVCPAQPDAPVPIAVALVPNLNPDGAALGTRTNARGVDLNRDHLRLVSAEAQALHRFVRTWRPHLIVDVHDFPPRRSHLLARQLIYCHDVFLDVPTHPVAQHPALGGEGNRLLHPILSALNSAGYRSARYTRVTRSGRVRHSTPDVVDARNGLALRYRLPTVLVEGRGASPKASDHPAAEGRVLAGIEATLSLIIRWARENHVSLTEAPPPLTADERVPVRTRYRGASGPCTLEFADARSGRIHAVEVPGRFTPALEAEWRVRLPRAYAVPLTQRALLDVLRRHAFDLVPSTPDRIERIERYQIEGFKPPKRPDRSPHEFKLSVRTERRPLGDCLLVPVTENGGPALAVFLEPASKHGLARFADMGLPLTPQSAYPVGRVV